jgi:hypothetical protein
MTDEMNDTTNNRKTGSAMTKVKSRCNPAYLNASTPGPMFKIGNVPDALTIGMKALLKISRSQVLLYLSDGIYIDASLLIKD